MGCQQKAEEVGVSDQFPAGLRVLMVDDDVTCLKILEQMLRRCLYTEIVNRESHPLLRYTLGEFWEDIATRVPRLVTSCSQATVALNLLREKKGCFDIVLSDVHMPDMDGFKLLELVGLEMNLPVIMMSADGRTSAVMQGIRHGACDYLIKPIREEELKNLWQHVVRKKWNENKEHEPSCSLNDIERPKRGNDDSEYASSYNSEGGEGLSKREKKRRDENEEDCDTENDDPSQPKKPRVVWSVELHQQFVSAVNHLGIDKAVPKRILELMNVSGLTRENVASHLQKFRLYLKRLSQHQGGISGPYCGPIEQNAKLGSFNGFDMHTLVTSGQIPPQTLAALQAELLGRPTGSLSLSGLDHSLPGSFQGSNTSKQFQQNVLATGVGPNNFGALAGQNSNVFMGMLHNQQQQKQLLVPESSHSINVQPSCLVVPSLSSPNSRPVKDPASVNQNFIFDRNCTINYDILSSQQSSSSFGGSNTRSVVSGYSVPLSTTSSVSFGSMNPNIGNIQDSMSTQVDQSFDQGSLKSLGFVGKRSSIPSRFAIDETEFPINNLNYVQTYMDNRGRRVKQEPSLSFVETERVGVPILQNYSTSDLTSVNSE